MRRPRQSPNQNRQSPSDAPQPLQLAVGCVALDNLPIKIDNRESDAPQPLRTE
ncbi:hypothetical protein [Microcoleus sp. bin38.metabat.b11b12b14.051]|uniref:hypothetical protein n=1 Tax=Microcoleus sp. bin38.metabat.b11b12b14.051 TaxID=2742709 RepID=UPI0025DC2591|nr:hypothetical protein [Microcoleus sp. bin38.metabat.b11b12b14.051]